MTRIRVGGLWMMIFIVYYIYVSHISEIDRTLVQWWVGLPSKWQVGCFSNTPLNIQNIGTICMEVYEINTLHTYCICWLIILFLDFYDWFNCDNILPLMFIHCLYMECISHAFFIYFYVVLYACYVDYRVETSEQ